jgi:signal transduction histidine kinase
MLREGVPIGILILTRSEVRPFTDKQIELVTTFADQAAIAIENVRLFEEIQDKSRQLEEASQHKSQFLANMSHELRTPLNAILGYTELMTDGAYGEPSEKMFGILKRLEANGKHLLGLINDVNWCSNYRITAFRISHRPSAARSSRWRPIRSSGSKSRSPRSCLLATATDGA